MEDRELKAAIIGCGNIARVHAACLEHMEGIKLVAICDIVLDRAETLAKIYKANIYKTYEEMLEKETIDVVHICTPHHLHVPMSIYCLEKGKYIFLEKPPIISTQQLLELGAVPQIDRLGVCFQNRYNTGLRWVRELLASGRTGRILGARGIVTWSRDISYYKESSWRGQLDKEGGGALINQSIHTLDILVYLMGTPLKVSALMGNHHLKEAITVEDTIEAYIEFETGKVVFYATTAYCVNSIPIIEVSCENMTIRLEEPRITLIHKNGEVEVILVEKSEAFGKDYWGNGHQACISAYYDAVRGGRNLPLRLIDVKDTMELMLAMYQSANSLDCEEIILKPVIV